MLDLRRVFRRIVERLSELRIVHTVPAPPPLAHNRPRLEWNDVLVPPMLYNRKPPKRFRGVAQAAHVPARPLRRPPRDFVCRQRRQELRLRIDGHRHRHVRLLVVKQQRRALPVRRHGVKVVPRPGLLDPMPAPAA